MVYSTVTLKIEHDTYIQTKEHEQLFESLTSTAVTLLGILFSFFLRNAKRRLPSIKVDKPTIYPFGIILVFNICIPFTSYQLLSLTHSLFELS